MKLRESNKMASAELKAINAQLEQVKDEVRARDRAVIDLKGERTRTQ